MGESRRKAVEVFYSYAHKDEPLRNDLEKHLKLLQRQGFITQWHDRRIGAGTEWAHTIDSHLHSAAIILLLVSADFMASDYCYDIELDLALERHRAGEARVVPIILRPVDWQSSRFGQLQALPSGGKPVTRWQDHDEALCDIANELRTIIEELSISPPSSQQGTVVGEQGYWGMPYRRNLFFTNREETLRHLHQRLHTQTTTVQAYALSGMSGIGKTQTAIEYAYRHRADYQYVFWLTSDTHETLITDVVAVAEKLDLPEKKAQDQQITVRAVKRWLQQHRDWLLVLDNADNLKLVRDFIPHDVTGHILLTTRAHAFGGLAQRFALDKMGQQEGALFLLRRAGLLAPDQTLTHASTTNITYAQHICALVDGFPLALEQAGAYIEEVSCSLKEFIDLYQTHPAALLKWRGGTANEQQEPVANVLALSLQKVEQANPAAAELLRFCAFLQPEAIPVELFSEEAAAELGPVLGPVAAHKVERNNALSTLLNFSLVQRDASADTLAVHRVTQVVIRDMLDETARRLWIERVVRALNSVFPDPRFYESWRLCQNCLPAVQVCADMIEQWDLRIVEVARLLTRAGYYLMRRGRYVEANAFYQHAEERGKLFLAQDHPERAETVYRQGELLYMQGRYTEAEPLYQQALAIRERVLGAEHTAVALSEHNLGLLYYEQGRYAEAETMFLRSLAVWEKTLGPAHPDVAECLNNLAALYRFQGRYAEVEPLLQRALAIRQQALGEESPDTVLSIHMLGKLSINQQQYEKAETLLQHALTIAERVLGREHAHVAAIADSLGEIAEQRGDVQEAKRYYRQAVMIGELALGREHPHVRQYMNHLAGLYGK